MFSYLAGVEADLMAMPREKGAREGPGTLWSDPYTEAEYPAMYEFMRETSWDDGKPRKTGSVLLVVDGRSIKASVHDRDGRRTAWVTAETLQDLLKAVDQKLSQDDMDWRRDTR